jgi:CheY-like chemotaxis protein
VLSKIKQRCRDPPGLMVTAAYGQDERRNHACECELGAFDFATKPVGASLVGVR